MAATPGRGSSCHLYVSRVETARGNRARTGHNTLYALSYLPALMIVYETIAPDAGCVVGVFRVVGEGEDCNVKHAPGNATP